MLKHLLSLLFKIHVFSPSLSPSLFLRRPSSRKRKTPIPSKRLSHAMHLGDSEDESFGSGTPDVSDGETPDDSSTVRIKNTCTCTCINCYY